ncbi:MAG: hypothetical protein JWP66_1523 [Naasia sp.]|nr:hypothetical protein [Naasia sp.]
MKRVKAFFAIGAVLVLAACSGSGSAITPATSDALQVAVYNVTAAVAGGDAATALAALQVVRDQADAAVDRDDLSERRHAEIIDSIEALVKELEDAGAPKPTPGATPIPTRTYSGNTGTKTPVPAPDDEEPAPEEPEEPAPAPSQPAPPPQTPQPTQAPPSTSPAPTLTPSPSASAPTPTEPVPPAPPAGEGNPAATGVTAPQESAN